MERRNFIKQCGVLGASCLGILIVAEGCKTPVYVTGLAEGNKIRVKKSEFLENRFVMVKSEKLPSPVYLLKQGENEFSAVLMLCTHKGCELNPAGNNLFCPCHGSEFTNTGKVLNPPADRDLKKYPVTTDMENIYITI